MKIQGFKNFLAYPIFYGWNILFFFTLLSVEISERIFTELVYSVFQSYTPSSYLFQALIIFSIPIISFFLGIRFFGKNPKMLMRWFYGFEVPLIMLALFRIFGFKELTPDVAWWFGFLLITVAGYGAHLLIREKLPAMVTQILVIFRFVAGILFATFLLIYTVPMLWIALKSIPEIDIQDFLEIGFIAFILLLFFLFTGSLFIVSPIAFILFYIRDAWFEIRRIPNKKRSLLLSSPIAVLLIVIFLYPRQQPQSMAFETVESWNKGEVSDVEAIRKKDKIRAGLVNAYLMRYRYLDEKGENRDLKSLYKEAFDTLPKFVESTHGFLISPFMYNGSWEDQNKAALDYERFFDRPIERAEREPIVDAMSASFQPRRAEAAILSIDQKQVEVTGRDLTTREISPGVVEVEFHERYVNRTFSRQEVFYYFSLPANCVVTGLWLSDTDDTIKKYPHIIAPRGAAQETYREIRRARMDPALLEQVGPYQYRLRIFPILARAYNSYRNRDEEVEEKPMHVTLRLLCLTNESGEIDLPELTEKRNVYWENGLAGCTEEQWFPAINEKFGKQGERLLNTEVASVSTIADLPKRRVNEKFIICLDGSYSMNDHRDDFEEFWKKFPYKSQAELYLLQRGKMNRLNADNPEIPALAGTNNPMSALRTLSRKFPESHLVWITDQGNYELLSQDSSRKGFDAKNPIDLIHLNGYAPIYEDAFIESIINSGGQVFESGDKWLANIQAEYDRTDIHWRYGDQIIFFNDSLQIEKLATMPATAYWASRYAMARSQDLKSNSKAAELDELHALAVKYSFVSPFSSMICLVNARQKELLADKTRGDDRYQREVETGKTSGTLGVIDASGVPEPHEWILLIFGGGLLLYLYRHKRNRDHNTI